MAWNSTYFLGEIWNNGRRSVIFRGLVSGRCYLAGQGELFTAILVSLSISSSYMRDISCHATVTTRNNAKVEAKQLQIMVHNLLIRPFLVLVFGGREVVVSIKNHINWQFPLKTSPAVGANLATPRPTPYEKPNTPPPPQQRRPRVVHLARRRLEVNKDFLFFFGGGWFRELGFSRKAILL